MRFLSTKTHGVLDYTSGLLLILAPWLFNFDTGGAAQWVPILVGFAILIMSIFTDYELGVVKSISMTTHLNMDVLIGIFLAVSPWIFSFANVAYLPHLILGIFAVFAGLMTRRVPSLQNIT